MSTKAIPSSFASQPLPRPAFPSLGYRWFFSAAALLLVVFGAEMYVSVRTESQTFDEPAHLYSGYSYWLHSDFGVNPEHPPLAKLVAALPLLLVDRPAYPPPINGHFRAVSAMGGLQILYPPGSDILLNHGRAAMTVFALLLAVLVTLAASEMLGKGTALVALLLFVFDPLIIGHAPLITTDVAAACFIFASVYAFYRYVKKPSLMRLAICGTSMGLALAAKHSALFVFAILFLLGCAEILLPPSRPLPASNSAAADRKRIGPWLRMGIGWIAIGMIAVIVLWGSYGFRYQARPDGQTIIPTPAQQLEQLGHPAEASLIGFAERHHLLPEAYLFGLADIVQICRDGRVMNIFGHVYPNGRWFYFPGALLIKCTIGFLILLLLLPFSGVLWQHECRREIVFMLVPPAAFFAWAMTSKLDIGIRHIMPVFPFLIVLAAAGAVRLAHRSRPWAWAVGLLLLVHAASSLRAAPNYLPYSNEFFGGPENTHKVLTDSNVGWRGGLKALSANIRERGIHDCWLAYSALPDPATFGIPCKRLPTFFGFLVDQGQQQTVPEQIDGPVFISSAEVASADWGAMDLDPYQQFAALRPTRVIAGEILEYDGHFSIPRIAAFSHTVVSFGVFGMGKSAAPDSIRHAQTAVALDANSILANQALVFAYAAHGRKDDALRAYQETARIFNTVHPEFQKDEFPPINPFAAGAH